MGCNPTNSQIANSNPRSPKPKRSVTVSAIQGLTVRRRRDATRCTIPVTLVMAPAGSWVATASLCLPSGGRFSRASLRLLLPETSPPWRAVPTRAAPVYPSHWRSSVMLPESAFAIPRRDVPVPVELAFRGARPHFVLVRASSQTQAGAVQVEDCSGPRLAGDRMFQVWAGA